MTRIVPYENLEQRYEDLAKAIVIQATDDYKRYKFVLDTLHLRKYKDETGRYNAKVKAARAIKSVEAFFKSPWFRELSDLDGEKAIFGLEKTYETEYYPIRMEEMMDETKVGRFRTK